MEGFYIGRGAGKKETRKRTKQNYNAGFFSSHAEGERFLAKPLFLNCVAIIPELPLNFKWHFAQIYILFQSVI
jgi:hypothetical protein